MLSDKLQLVGSTYFAQGLRIVTTLVMARMLTPEDYGAFTLVVALGGLFAALGDLNLPASVVHVRGSDEQTVVDTALVLGVGVYVVYGLATVGGGVYLSYRYDDFRLLAIAGISALTSLLGIIYAVQLAQLNRRMQFASESRQNIIFGLAQAATGITLAALGAGMFALALQGLVAQLFANAALLRKLRPHWPRLARRQLAKHMLVLGSKASIGMYFWNLQQHVTSIVVNQMGGQAAVGVWGRATQVQQLLSQNVMTGFERVIYPKLCAVQEDAAQMRSLYQRGIVTLMIFAAFTTPWLAVEAHDAVLLVLGPQWERVPPLLVLLAFLTPVSAFQAVTKQTAYAIGKTSWVLAASVVAVLVYVVALLVVAAGGTLETVALVWLGSRVLFDGLVFFWTARHVRPQLGQLVGRISVMLLAGALAGALMWFLDAQTANWPRAARLLGVSTTGGLVYAALIWLLQKPALHDALRLAGVMKHIAPEPAGVSTAQASTGSSP